ncbi:glycine cleavage system aminomethyltransferase GcvT [Rhodovastum atsumiense]|uniref:aminomethyltransferase n=1 Tax=Rhodovastum atsumiense TaxID=504468 RepID=A0A5M6J2B4_9PROT|nr:glycine cleavage system aminomethyltransferase GcvT [Rhodovastum atsumiense]
MKTTPLDSLHRTLGARMVPFAGYSMPVQYPAGVLAEHLHCRAEGGAALFDVSHMGQGSLHGALAPTLLESLVPGDIAGLKPGRQRYTLLTNEAGGIIDDLMVANLGGERLFLVVNASRKEVDFGHIAAHLPEGVRLERHDDRALLALQGPAAATVLGRLAPETATLPFMGVAAVRIDGLPCLVSRSGYTGEDGFEISVPAEAAEALARRLLDAPEVKPAGLGARDSLRLEAGLPLYGNDIDELTTPVEAGLAWAIGKRRRADWRFPGGEAICDQLAHGCTRLRVGLRPDGRAPARAGTNVVAPDGTAGGSVTSGGFGPSLGAPVAMGYVRRDLAAPGTPIQLLVRGRPLPAQVVPLPFVSHRYVR